MADKSIDTPTSPLFDIKAEVLAASLMGKALEGLNLSVENILMAPISDRKRRSSKDVSKVITRYFDHEDVLQIDMNRKGFYDSLPPHLFHKLDKEYDTPKKRTRAIKRQEAEARKFFLPFEQAAFTPRIETELLEQKYFDSFPPFIKTIWGLDAFSHLLTQKQAYLFCHLLPEAYRVVGDWELTELIFETALGKPISLRFAPPEEIELKTKHASSQDLRLGEDAVLGNSFRDEFLQLEVVVKGVTSEDLEDFLPFGSTRTMIEDLLCSYFIPLDVPYSIVLDVTEDSLGMTLGVETLGYNTMLLDELETTIEIEN